MLWALGWRPLRRTDATFEIRCPRHALIEAAVQADDWDYDDRFDVADGVALIDTAGHTPGHQSLDVRFADGRRFTAHDIDQWRDVSDLTTIHED